MSSVNQLGNQFLNFKNVTSICDCYNFLNKACIVCNLAYRKKEKNNTCLYFWSQIKARSLVLARYFELELAQFGSLQLKAKTDSLCWLAQKIKKLWLARSASSANGWPADG